MALWGWAKSLAKGANCDSKHASSDKKDTSDGHKHTDDSIKHQTQRSVPGAWDLMEDEDGDEDELRSDQKLEHPTEDVPTASNSAELHTELSMPGGWEDEGASEDEIRSDQKQEHSVHNISSDNESDSESHSQSDGADSVEDQHLIRKFKQEYQSPGYHFERETEATLDVNDLPVPSTELPFDEQERQSWKIEDGRDTVQATYNPPGTQNAESEQDEPSQAFHDLTGDDHVGNSTPDLLDEPAIHDQRGTQNMIEEFDAAQETETGDSHNSASNKDLRPEHTGGNTSPQNEVTGEQQAEAQSIVEAPACDSDNNSEQIGVVPASQLQTYTNTPSKLFGRLLAVHGGTPGLPIGPVSSNYTPASVEDGSDESVSVQNPFGISSRSTSVACDAYTENTETKATDKAAKAMQKRHQELHNMQIESARLRKRKLEAMVAESSNQTSSPVTHDVQTDEEREAVSIATPNKSETQVVSDDKDATVLREPTEVEVTKEPEAPHISTPKYANSNGEDKEDDASMKEPIVLEYTHGSDELRDSQPDDANSDVEEADVPTANPSAPRESEELAAEPSAPNAIEGARKTPSELGTLGSATQVSNESQLEDESSIQDTVYAKSSESARDDTPPDSPVEPELADDGTCIKRDADTEDDESAVTPAAPSVLAAPEQVTFIDLPANNDLVEDGHAVTLGVVDFPLLEPGEAHLTGVKGTSTEPFNTTGRKPRVPGKGTHYDSRGVVEVLAFAYTTKDTNMSRSTLSQYENFNHKRDLKPNAPSGKPAYIRVNGHRYFLCYAGQIALWGSKNTTHEWKNPELWTVQNDVRKPGLSPIMLVGNVNVPDRGMGQPMHDLPKELFDEFVKQPKKSASLKLNKNANGVRKPKRDAAPEDEESPPPRTQKKKATKPAAATSETNDGHLRKKRKLAMVEDDGDRFRDSFRDAFEDGGMEQGDRFQDGDMDLDGDMYLGGFEAWG